MKLFTSSHYSKLRNGEPNLAMRIACMHCLRDASYLSVDLRAKQTTNNCDPHALVAFPRTFANVHVKKREIHVVVTLLAPRDRSFRNAGIGHGRLPDTHVTES